MPLHEDYGNTFNENWEVIATHVVKQEVPTDFRCEPEGGLEKPRSMVVAILTKPAFVFIIVGIVLCVALGVYLILCGEGTGCDGGILGSRDSSGSSGFCPYSDVREWLG